MDVAALSLNIDSSKVVQAANDLDRFSAASAKAGTAAGNQSGSIAKLVALVQSMDAKLGAIIGSLDKMAAAQTGAAVSAQKMASANDNVARSIGNADNHVIAYREHLRGLVVAQQAAAVSAKAVGTAQQNANAHVLAYQNYLQGLPRVQADANAHVEAYRRHLESLPPALGNIGRSSEAAGGGILRFAGFAVASVVTIGLLVTTLAAAAFGAIAFAGAYFNLKESVGKSTDALGLNEKQLDRLKKQGIDTSVTLKDAFSGLGYAIGVALKDAFEGPLKGVAEAASKMWDDVVAFSSAAFDTIVKTTIGTVAAIVAVWSDVPNVMTDLFFQGVNKIIDGYNAIVQAGWSFFFTIVDAVAGIPAAIGNAFMGGVQLAGSAFDTLINWGKAAFAGLVYLWQNWPQILGDLFIAGVKAAFAAIVWLYEKSRDAIKALWNGGADLLTGNVGPVANPATGAAAAGAVKATKAFNDAGTAYDRMKAKFAADFRKGTLDARNTRLTTAAGSAGATPKGGKTDAEKLADIYKAAQAEIAVQETRARAVGLSARTAAEMEERTKLLNQVEKAGIPITAAVTAEVNRLSKAYADAKIAADTATAIQGVTDDLVKQQRAVADQVALIGLYGDALNRAKREQEALNAARDALPRGEKLSPAAESAIKAGAGKVSDAEALANQQKRAEEFAKASRDSAYAMDLERGSIGLTGAALIAYNYSMEEKIRQQQKGIDLSPAEIAAIDAAGEAYGRTRNAIDQQAKAIADTREITKGFFSGWINGARQSGDAFKSFVDSAINSVNRLIDKLLDKGLDAGLDKLFSAGGGGGGGFLGAITKLLGGGGGSGLQSQSLAMIAANPSIFAKGGAFGTAQRFAKGGAFTNQVINTPTLFRFANGGALGEMGEAGPEAVMPLARGPNGKLGVQMMGGGRSAPPSVSVAIQQDFHLVGTVSQKDVETMSRAAAQKGAEIAVNTVKRNFDSYLREWDDEGAVVS